MYLKSFDRVNMYALYFVNRVLIIDILFFSTKKYELLFIYMKSCQSESANS